MATLILLSLNQAERERADALPAAPIRLKLEPSGPRAVENASVGVANMRFNPLPEFLLTAAVTLALALPASAQQADVRLPSLGS